jgi:oligopeptide/dipeptide ABC transporter ATP-binding protein
MDINDKELLLVVNNVKKHFPIKKGFILQKTIGTVKAVDDVSFGLHKGETLGIIGESGCGKTTLSRMIIGLIDATAGSITFAGEPISTRMPSTLRRRIQMVSQNPYSSVDPRMNIERIVEEPLRIHTHFSRAEKREMVLPILDQVGMTRDVLNKFPHEFSGGQIQRIGIARALVLHPDLVVCDEPVSALDVSIQAQILNLFKAIQKKFNLTYIFISHEMSVIRHVSDRIAVMYLGEVVELANKKDLFNDTLHPYSIALMSAIPIPDPLMRKKRIILEGELPSPIDILPGCPFQTRCSFMKPICKEQRPVFKEIRKDHFVACHLF